MTFASGETYKVNVLEDFVVEGKTLKAGEYKVSAENGTVVFKKGKESVEVPGHAEKDSNKFADTTLKYKASTELSEIRVGGTHAKIVLESAATTSAGQ